ncbi:S-adenosyl-L-methionine-dependent methyltransferase [Pelagophyceae sp. CCMP2097]|nr:S-adenosyl-L-methionine-dependent methyltransferase [Pelagophyceae sp. CCMP2097]
MESPNAKLFLLASLLCKDGVITNNGKAFMKELILSCDPRLLALLGAFEERGAADVVFIDSIHELIESEAFVMYEELFDRCSLEVGKQLSKGERQARALGDVKNLIYGEVDFAYFARILRKINPTAGGVFIDLGSGTGKAVFIARLLYDFRECRGVEVLQGLHDAGAAVAEAFRGDTAQALWTRQPQDVDLQCASFLDVDWSDADVVFANSTCFDEDLMSAMSRQAESLKPGAYFVTFTKGLSSDAFDVLERKRYRMSWGPATVFIHQRKHADGASASAELVDIADDDSYKFDSDDVVSDDDDDDGDGNGHDSRVDGDEGERDDDVP